MKAFGRMFAIVAVCLVACPQASSTGATHFAAGGTDRNAVVPDNVGKVAATRTATVRTEAHRAGSGSTTTPTQIDRSANRHAATRVPLSATAHARADALRQLTLLKLRHEPFASVFIVTSGKTFDGIRRHARDAVTRRDSTGAALVVSEISAYQLDAVSEYVHHRERRCGGFFAFATRAEADAFIDQDRSAQAIRRAMGSTYTLDNQATVGRWLPLVQESRIYGTIDHLSGYQNRSTPARPASRPPSGSAIPGAMTQARSDISTELFTACSGCSTQPSVILTIRGSELADEIVVLGGHLDSINASGGGNPNQWAPGADDDASGIATLTEILHVAVSTGWRPKRTVKFMAYAAEEVGLRGSNAIAQSFRAAGVNVVGALQLDMTNYKSGPVADMRLITDYSNADLKDFFVVLFDAYLAPLGLTRGTYTCGYGCSDHASWTGAGYPAAMMFEAGNVDGFYPWIHTVNDTLAQMEESAQHSVKFAQFGLAFLGELSKTSTIPVAECRLPASVATGAMSLRPFADPVIAVD